VRPKMLELLEPLAPMAEKFAAGLGEGIAEWVEENVKMEMEVFPAIRKEIFKLSGNAKALKKRALDNEVVNKNEAVGLVDQGGEEVLVSLIQQSEMKLTEFPRQR
jgi:transcription elongation GreA/GreB family factor